MLNRYCKMGRRYSNGKRYKEEVGEDKARKNNKENKRKMETELCNKEEKWG